MKQGSKNLQMQKLAGTDHQSKQSLHLPQLALEIALNVSKELKSLSHLTITNVGIQNNHTISSYVIEAKKS